MKKLPVTWGSVVRFIGYSNPLPSFNSNLKFHKMFSCNKFTLNFSRYQIYQAIPGGDSLKGLHFLHHEPLAI